MSQNPKPEIAATSDDREDRLDKASTSAPDLFNLQALKINMSFKEDSNVRKVLNVVPARKPKMQNGSGSTRPNPIAGTSLS